MDDSQLLQIAFAGLCLVVWSILKIYSNNRDEKVSKIKEEETKEIEKKQVAEEKKQLIEEKEILVKYKSL